MAAKILAFTGRKGSGKDTAAQLVLRRIPYAERFAFADMLKDVTAMIWGVNRRIMDDPILKDAPAWAGGPTYRWLLQRLGVAVRTVDQAAWVNHTLDVDIPAVAHLELAVITDCRFPDEAAAIRLRGGLVFRIERPGYSPRTPLDWWPWARAQWLRWVRREHPSETLIDRLPVDGVIINDGTPEWLDEKIRTLLRRHQIGPAVD